jgi:subtilisin-like proprotein convertase family protein
MVKFAGGNGANAPGSTGGGGGSSAGTAAGGANGSGQSGGNAPADGGDGGDGGNAGFFVGSGEAGTSPGGGGGGAEKAFFSTDQGGNGANGQVIVTYIPPPYENGTCMAANATNTIVDNGCGTNDYRNIPFNLNSTGSTLGTDVFVQSVDLIVSHTWGSDLRLYLRSPNNNEVALVNAPYGGTGTQYGNAAACPAGLFTFQDGGAPLSGVATNSTNVGTWAPDQALTLFNDGSDPNGLWTIRACDAVAQDVGAIRYARVNLCYPPQATFTNVNDCTNNQFQVSVNVSNLGSGASGTITYSVDDGTPVVMNGVMAGTTLLGPFPALAEVSVTLTSDIAGCGSVSGTVFSTCPVILDCGMTTNVQHCYRNSDTRTFTFLTPTPGETVTLDFVQGSLDLNDGLNIYDGTNNLAPALGGGNFFGNLTGQTFTSTGPAIHLVISSNGTNSCADGGQTTPWLFEAKCTPSCYAPDAIVDVIDDCGAYTFTLEVLLFDPGDASTVDLSYEVNGGTPVTVPNIQLFTTEVLGPFTVGDQVNVRLLHDLDALCHKNLGNFTNITNCPSADNCVNALNLANQSSPLPGTTVGRVADLSIACGTASANTAADAMYYIDVPAGTQLDIRQQSNTYDSQHYVRFGGACPGNTAIACVDDDGGEVAWVNWVNTTGSTQRVWWIQDGKGANTGTFVLEWQLISCPSTVATAASNVQSSSAEANYQGFAGNYIVEYGPSASFTTPGTDANAGTGGTVVSTAQPTNLVLSSLAPGTEYRYFVRRHCGGSSFGANSNAITFTTTTGTPVQNGVCAQNVTIPDISCALNNGPNALITISGQPGTLGAQRVLESVDLIMSHTNRSDLIITLTSPTGTTRNMILQRGGSGDNFGNPSSCPGSVLKLRDGGAALTAMPGSNNVTGTYAPEEALNGYTGAANGVWTLSICDNAFSFFASGALQYVRLNFAPLDCEGVMNGPAVPGTACDDGNACTVNDVYGPSCDCAGTVLDTDNDGTCDANDGCPNDPLKVAPGECGCGALDTDTDTDGIADCNDGCPNDPLKIAPGACGCGVADVDSDNDGLFDCDDDCPSLAGVIGSPCDDGDAFTILDQIDGTCTCAGTTCTELVNLELDLDMQGSQTWWRIAQQGTGTVVCSGGLNPTYPNNVPFPIVESCCLPVGCYTLEVHDTAGDGIAGGGYELRENGASGRRIIDNTGNFATGLMSAVADGGTFCVPIGNTDLIYSNCDKLDWVSGQYLVCHADANVTNEWVPNGSNAVQDNNSGYNFWIFDPNGSFSFRKFRTHSVSDGFSPANATRAAHMKINGWSHSALTPHIPAGVLMNVRVRPIHDWNVGAWGPTCTMKIDPVRATCPVVWLQDDPANPSDYSCGVVRNFGGPNGGANKIVADPPQFSPAPLAGGSGLRYQFRFRIPGEGTCIVRPPQTSPTLFLNWSNGPGLEASKTYEVEVRVSKDQGATWCVDVPNPACDPSPVTTWGKTCNVTIGTVVSATSESNSITTQGNGTFTMYPNPNRGDQLFISLTEVDADVNTVSVDIYDMTGKRVIARTMAIQGGRINTALDLSGSLTGGVYLVNMTVGTKTRTERLVIQP